MVASSDRPSAGSRAGSAGISDPWDRRSSLLSSRRSSVLVLTTSGVPLWEWSLVLPSSPSDTDTADRFSELKGESGLLENGMEAASSLGVSLRIGVSV
ncbi:hypothetical protein J4Q44_G00088000 [Coregonus suidteri]|uniref:Uncharacterized protein n=1 Tax=Coregonus suidteri TaxID=861788 RepID=A0AAN8M3P4_9TELE